MRGKTFHLRDARFTLGFVMAVLAGVVSPVLFPGTGSAQAITPTTGTGNLGTAVTQNGNTYTITGGTRPGGGTNLFHSFGEFGVPTNNIANFQNNTGLPTSNILGRVTGGNPSNIFGTLKTTDFGPANLFLMNPAGIVFGPNATLNVGGSVNFTTADYIRLFDGVNSAMFYANPASDAVTAAGRTSILSSAPLVDFGFVTPAAFGFLTNAPASIAVQGSALSVPANQSISLVGGDVIIGSASAPPTSLSAPNGQIKLASAASPGEFADHTLQPLPNVDGASFSSFGSIALAENSTVNVSGTNTVSIRGGAFILSVDNAVLTTAATAGQADHVTLSNGSVIRAETRGATPSGDITLIANTVQLSDGSTIATSSQGGGAAGNINLTLSKSLTLQGVDPSGNPSRILSDTNSSGNSGAINIQAPSGSVMLDGGLIRTLTSSDGLAGDINLNVRNLTALAGGQIVTSGSDAAPSGSITVNASDTISFSGRIDPSDASSASGIFNVNNGFNGTGNISIKTGNLRMADGARIRNDAFFDLSGTETPKISIAASNAVTLSGGSGIIVDTTFSDVGSLAISAHSISLSDVSVISTRTVGPGAGGQLTLNADTISINGGSQVVSSTEQDAGRGGDVTIVATDRLNMSGQGLDQNGSTVSSGIFTFSSPFATGDAGNVSISARTVEISGGAQANSSTFGSGRGGSVAIQGLASHADSVLIAGMGSGILTETQGTGNGGNITAWSNQVQLTNGATISAKTAGSGNAGNILVKADTFSMNGGSTITAASTGSGNAGTVTIQGINSPANSVLIEGAGTGLFTNTEDRGKGGDIAIDTRTLTMQNGGTISAATSGTGESATGGNITITASESVDLRSNASVSASSTGDADAGNISINAGNRFDARNSSVTTRSEHAGGGNIEINALDQIRLVNSQVNASAFLNGGNVSIDPNLVILQNSSILAQAIQGNGGNITIFTPLFLADSSSLVNASSQFGLNGTVTIQSPTSNLSGSLGTLATKPRQAQSLLTQRCAALANGQASSFVVAGREQLPADPGGWLTSPLALAGLDADPFREGTVAEGTSNLAPRTSGLLANGTVSLRRFTPAGFLMANYVDSEATGCHS